MSFKFFDKLSQDFSELLNDKKEYNVVIEVDKELENATTNENQVKTLIKPNISAQIFEIILK